MNEVERSHRQMYEGFGAMPEELLLRDVRLTDVTLSCATLEADRSSRRGAVVFIPGVTGAKEDFYPVFRWLAANGYDVHSFSQRGQVDSIVADTDQPFGLSVLVEDLYSVVQALCTDSEVHLVGHSFGGLVAIEAAISRPDRLSSLTIWNSGPIPQYEPSYYDDVLRDLQVNGKRQLLEWAGDDLWLRQKVVSTQLVQLMAATCIARDQVDRSESLAEISIPILVSHGAFDDAWPAKVQREMAERLGAHYWVIAGAGHNAHADQPKLSANLLCAFWDAIV